MNRNRFVVRPWKEIRKRNDTDPLQHLQHHITWSPRCTFKLQLLLFDLGSQSDWQRERADCMMSKSENKRLRMSWNQVFSSCNRLDKQSFLTGSWLAHDASVFLASMQAEYLLPSLSLHWQLPALPTWPSFVTEKNRIKSLKMKENWKECAKSVKSLASLNIQALANSVTNGNSQIHVLGKAKMRPTTYKQRILLTLISCSKKYLQNLDCNTRHVISCYDSVIRNILSEMATFNQQCLNWAVHRILLRLQNFCRIWPHRESQCILWLRLTTLCGT